MAAFFVRQPNGLFARFHTGSDQFTHWNLSSAQAIDVYLEEQREDAIDAVAPAMDDRPTRFGTSEPDFLGRWRACVEAAVRVHGADDVDLREVIAEATKVRS